MKDLEGCQADDPRFDTLMTQLMSEIRSHVTDEEQNLFPRLAEACPEDALMDLGDKVRRAKKTAPTRPHPSAPDTPRPTSCWLREPGWSTGCGTCCRGGARRADGHGGLTGGVLPPGAGHAPGPPFHSRRARFTAARFRAPRFTAPRVTARE